MFCGPAGLLPKQIAVFVVAVLLSSPGCIGNLDRQCPGSQVFDVLAAAEGIAGFNQATDIVVAVAPFASLRVDAFQQLAGDSLFLPAIAEWVDVFVDLVQWAPIVVITAAEIVRDEGFTGF